MAFLKTLTTILPVIIMISGGGTLDANPQKKTDPSLNQNVPTCTTWEKLGNDRKDDHGKGYIIWQRTISIEGKQQIETQAEYGKAQPKYPCKPLFSQGWFSPNIDDRAPTCTQWVAKSNNKSNAPHSGCVTNVQWTREITWNSAIKETQKKEYGVTNINCKALTNLTPPPSDCH